jgi:S1-C subfamily serine protease
MVIPFISGFFRVSSRDFHLAHTSRAISVGSWVAVEPNGTGLPFTFNPPRLRAVLSSPKRGLPVNTLSPRVYKPHHSPGKPQTTLTHLNNGNSP